MTMLRRKVVHERALKERARAGVLVSSCAKRKNRDGGMSAMWLDGLHVSCERT